MLNVVSTIRELKNLLKNIYFIFFSSEMVYSGLKGKYSENDKTRPKIMESKNSKLRDT